jgi:hypothetical protein
VLVMELSMVGFAVCTDMADQQPVGRLQLTGYIAAMRRTTSIMKHRPEPLTKPSGRQSVCFIIPPNRPTRWLVSVGLDCSFPLEKSSRLASGGRNSPIYRLAEPDLLRFTSGIPTVWKAAN